MVTPGEVLCWSRIALAVYIRKERAKETRCRSWGQWDTPPATFPEAANQRSLACKPVWSPYAYARHPGMIASPGLDVWVLHYDCILVKSTVGSAKFCMSLVQPANWGCLSWQVELVYMGDIG